LLKKVFGLTTSNLLALTETDIARPLGIDGPPYVDILSLGGEDQKGLVFDTTDSLLDRGTDISNSAFLFGGVCGEAMVSGPAASSSSIVMLAEITL